MHANNNQKRESYIIWPAHKFISIITKLRNMSPHMMLGFLFIFLCILWIVLRFFKRFASQSHTFHRTKHTYSRQARKLYKPPTEYFLNKDNLYIYYSEKQGLNVPNEEVKFFVLIVHGIGEHSGRYQQLSETLVNELGVVVVSLDHQGHGKSEGDSLFVVEFEDYICDVMEVVRQTKKKFKNSQCILLGHSMGGLIAIRCIEKYAKEFSFAIISAPALSVHASSIERRLAPILSSVLPKFPMKTIDINNLSHDPCVVDLYANDPLVSTGGVTARLGAEILSEIDKALAFSYDFVVPYLLMRGSKDQIVSGDGIRQFHANSNSSDKTFYEFPELFHEIFQEPKSPAIPEVVKWLKLHLNF